MGFLGPLGSKPSVSAFHHTRVKMVGNEGFEPPIFRSQTGRLKPCSANSRLNGRWKESTTFIQTFTGSQIWRTQMESNHSSGFRRPTTYSIGGCNPHKQYNHYWWLIVNMAEGAGFEPTPRLRDGAG